MWVHRPAGLLGTRPAAIEFGLLPAAVQELFRKAFEDGATSPARRPTALAWNQALTGLAAGLRQCRSNPAHVYPPHLGGCPWCARSQPAAGKQATGPARLPWSFRR
jgi:DNA-binding helix-hairpin-helix protein with protein kinase domain